MRAPTTTTIKTTGHKGALYAIRNFWKLLLHSEVSFRGLVAALRDIQAAQARAERLYTTMIERYPTSPKVFRSYAKFLEDVRNNPWSATKFLMCARRGVFCCLEGFEGGGFCLLGGFRVWARV